MPLYSFVDRQGSPSELYMGMDEAPQIGASIWRDGIELTRIPEGHQNGLAREYRHVSHSLPRVDPKDPYWPHYNEKHQPVFTSKKQIKELQARIAHMGGSQVWS